MLIRQDLLSGTLAGGVELADAEARSLPCPLEAQETDRIGPILMLSRGETRYLLVDLTSSGDSGRSALQLLAPPHQAQVRARRGEEADRQGGIGGRHGQSLDRRRLHL